MKKKILCVCLQSCVQSIKIKKKIEIKTACTFVFKIATQPTKCPKKKIFNRNTHVRGVTSRVVHSFISFLTVTVTHKFK